MHRRQGYGLVVGGFRFASRSDIGFAKIHINQNLYAGGKRSDQFVAFVQRWHKRARIFHRQPDGALSTGDTQKYCSAQKLLPTRQSDLISSHRYKVEGVTA